MLLALKLGNLILKIKWNWNFGILGNEPHLFEPWGNNTEDLLIERRYHSTEFFFFFKYRRNDDLSISCEYRTYISVIWLIEFKRHAKFGFCILSTDGNAGFSRIILSPVVSFLKLVITFCAWCSYYVTNNLWRSLLFNVANASAFFDSLD